MKSNRLSEDVRLALVGKVETYLGVVSFECVEVGSGGFVLELAVDLLVKNQRLSVHVENSDVVRSFEVVLDETDHSTGPFVPSVTVAWTLASVHLQPNLITCGGAHKNVLNLGK